MIRFRRFKTIIVIFFQFEFPYASSFFWSTVDRAPNTDASVAEENKTKRINLFIFFSFDLFLNLIRW